MIRKPFEPTFSWAALICATIGLLSCPNLTRADVFVFQTLIVINGSIICAVYTKDKY